MRGMAFDVQTGTDGSAVVHPHGILGLEAAAGLRRVLVHTVRKVRPLCLVLDLADVSDVDPINLGTLAAVCDLGDDHQVTVFLDNSSEIITAQLAAAGVPRHRLRHRSRSLLGT